MKVLVMGAGAVGCFYGGMLARAGHEVVFVGRPRHVEAINARGLRFQMASFDAHLPVRANVAPEGGADLVLFCVKSGDTEKAGAELAPHLGRESVVLSLQNGVDNAERLAAVLGREVIPTTVYVGAEMAGDGHVRHHGRGQLVIGPSAQSERVAADLTAAGIPTQVSPDVAAALWEKLVINCAYNALSAIVPINYGALVATPGARAVMRDAIAECVAVARASGVTIGADLEAMVFGVAEAMPAQYSSTAQDLAANKPSEIDHLNGMVVRRGESLGVPTPVNRTLWTLVRALEQKRRAA